MSWCNAVLWVCHDVNVHMMQMYSYGYVVNANARLGMQWMQISPWEYAMLRMSAWECVMVWISSCRYAMNANAPFIGISRHGMLWCKHNLFKNSFYFQNEASTTPETKIFSKLDLLFMKSHLPFDLRLPKNWWSLLENLRMGHRLGIWWSGSKDSQFGWAQGVTHFQGLFLEKWILWKSSILKRFIFLVPE